MTDIQTVMSDFAARQAERDARVCSEIQHLKQLVIAPLQAAGISRVEIRFDGCGDSGAVEETVCLDATGAVVSCPDVAVARSAIAMDRANGADHAQTLAEALESLTYLALEHHHPGWEINDGACGELVVDVGEPGFVLDCQLRYTATHDHSTDL